MGRPLKPFAERLLTKPCDRLDRLVDLLVEDILSMSDEEIMAESQPGEGERVKAIFEQTLKGEDMNNTRYKIYFIKFYSPGIFLPTTDEKEVSRFQKDPRHESLPPKCYMFQRYTQEYIVDRDERFYAEKLKFGKNLYAPTCRLYSLDDVRAQYPERKTLIENMECNGLPYVVRESSGKFFPFDPKEDEILNGQNQ